ncbi:ATP-binding protein [Mesorhizobium sp. M0955]|uniref:AAA family ATPase n=1 Tax=Mesorhizobium sp. M0955 TaxID=2957033 RepID=UPI00333AF3D1
MLYGFVGPSRAGKTTLARKVSEGLAMEFHPTSTSKVAKEHGFDLMAPMTLADRVAVQNILLDNHIRELEELPRPLLIDRTPVDYLAYLLAEFNMTSDQAASPATLNAAYDFVNRCLSTTKRYYDFLYYLAPLPFYKAEDGKHADNKAFQQHSALLMQGILSELNGDVNIAYIHDTDLDNRVDFLTSHLVSRLDEIDAQRKAAHVH